MGKKKEFVFSEKEHRLNEEFEHQRRRLLQNTRNEDGDINWKAWPKDVLAWHVYQWFCERPMTDPQGVSRRSYEMKRRGEEAP